MQITLRFAPSYLHSFCCWAWEERPPSPQPSPAREGERSATWRRGGGARLAWCLAGRDFELDRPEPTGVEMKPGTISSGIRELPVAPASFVSQDIGGELVMRRDCPGLSRRAGLVASCGRTASGTPTGAWGVELAAELSAIVHAGFMLGVGGTFALTPTLSRSGEGERSTTWRRDGRARLTWRLAGRDFELDRPEPTVVEMEPGTVPSGIRELPVTPASFVSQDIGGELVMRRDCPGLSRRAGLTGSCGRAASGTPTGAWGVELAAELSAIVHAGFMLGVGGTSALTPTLSSSGGRAFGHVATRWRRPIGVVSGGERFRA